jgi:hypothetical protein
MRRGFSYVVARDYGFAPNPFYGFLTLATCKQQIRKHAKVGDFIIGHSSKEQGYKLIYMAKVSEVITFDEYWNNPKFDRKKPVMNGSFKKLYGDNIYHHLPNGSWMQEDSHHSNEDGSVNYHNLKRDTGTSDHVLVSYDFFYFGCSMIELPDKFRLCIKRGVGHKCPATNLCADLWQYLSRNYEKGFIDIPNLFKHFKRYDGKS